MSRFAVTRDSQRARITFDDGGMNLLSSAALTELSEAVASIGDCAVLTFESARPGLFAAGADMAEMRGFGVLEAEAFARQGQELFERIERLPCTTAALIDGDCFGGALDLALAFDVRLATPRSRFSHPGSKIGIVTGFGGTSRWRKVIDAAAARRLFLGNEVVKAGEALTIGLVDQVSDTFDSELSRLTSLDPAMTHFVRETSRLANRITQKQLMLMAKRLGALYLHH